MPIPDLPWACPSCAHALRGSEALCPACARPFAWDDGIAWFDGGPSGSSGNQAAYQRFLLARARTPLRDRYAAFQPFNEASRTWRGFAGLLAGLLRPGDLILDLGNRTGWSGAELAAAFPQQIVLSLWDGDRDVLGHRGFRHWFGAGRGPANLRLAFLPTGDRLPLGDGTVRWLHGHDLLHHRDPATFPAEVARVLDPAGCALFPHVHTDDAQPEPWFARGGTLRPAAAWRGAFAAVAGAGRSAVALGEAQLFEAMGDGTARLMETASGTDGNAVVALVPTGWIGAGLADDDAPPEDPGAAVLANPLVAVAAEDGAIAVESGADTLAGHLLLRHPVYRRRLDQRLPRQLGGEERLVHWWAGRLPDAAAIAARLGLPADRLRTILAGLHRQELVRLVRLPPTAARLQRCHANGADLPTVDQDHPLHLWRRAVTCFPERPCLVLEGGAALTYAQADEVVCALARRMARTGIGPGDALLLADGAGTEALLLVWAACLRGVTLVACDPTSPVPAMPGLRISAVFAREARWGRPGAALIAPDGAAPPGWTPLPSWYEDADLTGDDATAAPAPGAVGAVLFTTGSTGTPKGVLLSWAALARSARMLARHYRWSESDRLLCLGGLHTMSGLRNPAFAAIAAGAAVLPQPAAAGAIALAETVRALAATILSAAPATLQGLLAAEARAGRLAPPLRLAMVTGSRLPPGLRRRFRERHGVPVCNYYGLTETCGFCLGDGPEGDDGDSIGGPIDALLRLVDADDRDVPRGATGELLVHSANLLLGYLGEPPRAADDHWYRTGDLARLTAEGGCELVGRKREIVKNAYGEIVACREIEEALLAVPGVLDAAVAPGQGEDGLERAAAWVVPADPAAGDGWLDGVAAALHVRLGGRRMPDPLRRCPAIPRTSNGKLRRGVLAGDQP